MKPWPPPRDRWFPGFTAHRDGWVRSYRNQTVFCGGPRSTREEVESRWQKRKEEIDAKAERVAGPWSYRSVLSEFIKACRHRVATGRPRRMSERTLHNYVVLLNDFGTFVGGDTPIQDITQRHFADFIAKFGAWRLSGYDSVITRLSHFFRWAVGMGYLSEFKPGPGFARPAKADIRDQRIELAKSFTAEEFAKLYAHANPTERCWLGLGLFAAMINSEVAHLARRVVDLPGAVVDFRRRKHGKIRRVCPLPDLLVHDLQAYVRPDPAQQKDRDLFFLTVYGNPYSSSTKADGKPSDSMSRLFRELMKRSGVEHRRGRNFSGLRTTFYNLAPRSAYDIERKIIMGRAQGDIDLDHYLEDVGLDRLRHVVAHVFDQVSTSLRDQCPNLPAALTASAFASPTIEPAR